MNKSWHVGGRRECWGAEHVTPRGGMRNSYKTLVRKKIM
jgi:hypothetical protein